MRQLQHNKCAYCERDLLTETYAGGEHDVEHYRPKGACNPWPPATWPPGTEAAAREELDRLRAPDSPHAACARAFAKLWAADPAKAYLLARDAKV
jgi:hypothetical protein